MCKTQPHTSACPRTLPDATSRTLNSTDGAFSLCLEILASGRTLNFLEFMAAISELVAFYTERDSEPTIQEAEKILMSRNFCRFCT